MVDIDRQRSGVVTRTVRAKPGAPLRSRGNLIAIEGWCGVVAGRPRMRRQPDDVLSSRGWSG